jgi:hypothetical protein
MSCEKLVVGVSCALQSGGCRSNVVSSHLMSPYPRYNHTAPSSVPHAATLLSDDDRRRWPRPLALPAGIGTATLRIELEEANLGVMPVRQRGHEAVSRKGTLTPRLARSSHAPWIDDDVAFLNTYISSPAERLLSQTPSSPTITTTPAFSSPLFAMAYSVRISISTIYSPTDRIFLAACRSATRSSTARSAALPTTSRTAPARSRTSSKRMRYVLLVLPAPPIVDLCAGDQIYDQERQHRQGDDVQG